MDFACGDIASIANAIRLRSAADGERHFTIEDDVGRDAVVGVVRVICVCGILPDERMRETFSMQLRFEFADVHAADYTGAVMQRLMAAVSGDNVLGLRDFRSGEGHL
jgi:hypothetical protein